MFAGTSGTSGSTGDSGPATSAYLNGPQGVAVDSSATLYISDTLNCRVRLVTRSTGIITTFAGTGTCGSAADGGAPTNTAIYGPTGIAVDASNNVYFATSPWNAPGGSYGGALYYVAYGSSTITRLAGTVWPAGQCCSGPGLNTQLGRPNGVTVDLSGNVYVVDNFYQSIRVITKSTGIMTTFMGTGTPGSTADGATAGTSSAVNAPMGIVADAFDNVYIADPGDPNYASQSNMIYRVVLSTGVVERYAGTMNLAGSSGDGGPARLAKLNNPQFLAVDASGDVFIADAGNNAIREVTPQYPYTSAPSIAPTSAPTTLPTFQPSRPSSQPSQQPTSGPSQQPTVRPSEQPTSRPSVQPTRQPTSRPSTQPTLQPTSKPTALPTLVRLPTSFQVLHIHDFYPIFIRPRVSS